MIKNIIFDMGQVLIKFEPYHFISRLGVTDKNDVEILYQGIYKAPEWSMMDEGVISQEEGCKIIESRLPEHLRKYVADLTCNWDRPILPVEGAKELIKELKDNGYKIYLLSNASFNQKNYWPKIPGSEYFDGTVVSCFVKMIKPNKKIYEYLLNTYNLKAEECVFIDDAIKNVEGSLNVGIKGILFNQDYNEIRKKFIELGIKVKEPFK